MQVGDNVPVSDIADLMVVAITPNRSMVWQSAQGDTISWVLALYPINGSQTRLVWRIHTIYDWRSPLLVADLFTDLADLVAVRQNMLGIKARAEGAPLPDQASLNAEVALWTLTFLGLLVAAGGLIVRRDWLRPLLAVSVGSLIMIGLVLVKPPFWVDGLVTLGVCGGLGWLYWPAARQARPRP